VDIVATTNAENPAFALLGCHRLDASDYQAELVVQSGAFSGRLPFWFDRGSLERVVASLRSMCGGTVGECQLSYRYEEPYVRFTLGKLGHVVVSGLVLEGEQRLEFVVRTDQTALPALLAGFQGLASA
jgi:hypothetical protein